MEVKTFPSLINVDAEDKFYGKKFCLEIVDRPLHLYKKHNYYFQVIIFSVDFLLNVFALLNTYILDKGTNAYGWCKGLLFYWIHQLRK